MSGTTKVARAAAKAARARRELDNEIRAARAAGLTLREIAVAADLSPEWVRKIAQDHINDEEDE